MFDDEKNKSRERNRTTSNQQRIQKYLSSVGSGSRRGVENLLRQERILLNGRLACLGDRVKEGDRIVIDGGRSQLVHLKRAPLRVLAYNKPVGRICSRSDAEGWESVFHDLPKENGFRWTGVGRLDLNTSGLLLFTTDGELASRLMHPSYKVDREYAVRIYGEVTPSNLRKLTVGVQIEGERCKFSDVIKGRGEGANCWYTCVVQVGRNREVRHLWESLGVQVSRLIRVRFGNILLPVDLRPGATVELGGSLVRELCNLVNLERI